VSFVRRDTDKCHPPQSGTILLLPEKQPVFPSDTLQRYHAKLVTLRRHQMLLQEGDHATDFMQVESGTVKMYTVSSEGQEFIQGIFGPGESFGEPALIGGFKYPGNVIATEDSKIWKLPSDKFFQMLKDNFDLHLQMDRILCERLRYKSMVLSEISSHEPEHRILSLLKHFKAKNKGNSEILIPYTRQQLADMTGLRVETVIRAVKKMQKEKKLALDGHKIRF
jgi:CRP-like cAMP-binding protein